MPSQKAMEMKARIAAKTAHLEKPDPKYVMVRAGTSKRSAHMFPVSYYPQSKSLGVGYSNTERRMPGFVNRFEPAAWELLRQLADEDGFLPCSLLELPLLAALAANAVKTYPKRAHAQLRSWWHQRIYKMTSGEATLVYYFRKGGKP